ncbi:hypothetical protein [Maridesulfovibrio hydrothermalis]|uniref:EF-hand domain-containing protein n=1 Tax=Maridesulfovibrio hydrothermalis AM13 = DSM 14728 TaxID=1121451 RepID=L0R7Y6_9BACT|nr:hypothetical protein [Maridesulfovibrio hydrothermalis]CCO22342.1 conserved exported protein of unknown function [Maridesulfovibrio hydrothermalis AM13 = DSM 14728]
MRLRTFFKFTSISAVLLLLAVSSAFAQEKIFTVINHTDGVIRVWGKSNDYKFGRIKARTITDCTCNALYNKDCFDKKGNKAKIKLALEDKNGIDLWSGDTCTKLYIEPGTFIDVTMDIDGRHIKCALIDDYEVRQPIPSFEEADTNKDGIIDEKEAEAIQLKTNFKEYDDDLNKELNPKEFDRAVNKINIFRGVPF